MTLIFKWPRYVPSHQKWSFYVNYFKSYSLNRQTDRQTDGHTHTHMTKTLPLLHSREVIMVVPFHPNKFIRLNNLSCFIWKSMHLFNAFRTYIKTNLLCQNLTKIYCVKIHIFDILDDVTFSLSLNMPKYHNMHRNCGWGTINLGNQNSWLRMMKRFHHNPHMANLKAVDFIKCGLIIHKSSVFTGLVIPCYRGNFLKDFHIMVLNMHLKLPN